MNILLCSCTHWWNAEAHYAAILAECLREAGHKVWVLTQPHTRHAEQLERRGIRPVVDIPVWTRNLLAWPAVRNRFATFLMRNAVQVVDVFRSSELPFVLWSAASSPATRVVRTRGTARPVRGHWLNRRLYAACGGLIASANILNEELVKALELPREAVHTIYFPAEPPLDWSDRQRSEARERLLHDLGLPRDRVLLAIVGRVFPEKGHARLIEALAEVRLRHPDVALLIADKGYPDEAPHRERLKAHIALRKLEPHVRWLGFREDIRAVMACADYGVIPSLSSEMNCRVAMEFFSAGTPVVAFPTGALPEVVENNVTGIVTPDQSPDTLAGVLGNLIGNPGLRTLLARHAREAVLKRFSQQRFLEETLAVFQAALAGPRGAQ
jgi:glycosyltransferase involved in cell wall biosynthesis